MSRTSPTSPTCCSAAGRAPSRGQDVSQLATARKFALSRGATAFALAAGIALALPLRLASETVRSRAEVERLPETTLRVVAGGLSDSDLVPLARLKLLEELDLSRHPLRLNQISDLGLLFVADIASLRRLNLDNLPITDEGIKNLKSLGNLEELVLYARHGVTNRGLELLTEHRSLRKLTIRAAGSIDDRGLASLGSLSELEVLIVKGGSFSDSGIAHLSRLPRLTKLTLPANGLTDVGFDHIGKCAQLEVLSLRNCGAVTEAGYAAIGRLQRLRFLDLAECGVPDLGLKHLAGLPKLEELSLRGCEITDPGLRNLSDSRSLRSLDIGRQVLLKHEAGSRRIVMINGQDRVSDVGLRAVGRMRSLMSLVLQARNKITLSGLVELRERDSLTSLDLSYCRWITDDAIPSLSRLTRLRHLNLDGCADLSAVALKLLKARLPSCEITARLRDGIYVDQRDSSRSER